MSQTGSSLLKSLQNNNLPVLDLLSRECIQNSLDAALKTEAHNSVIVDLGTTEVDVPSLAKHFEGIEDTLIERFSGEVAKSLYISDTNTTGLTGNIDYRLGLQEAGNIYKLIYGINHAQTQEGAGGSWGLGKTVYFRLGVGLVIYYTRILNENMEYEERLAATLVENEDAPTTILPKESSWNRGIAWWGKELEPGNTIPTTNTDEIYDILDSLNIKPFMQNETGTKVIIPFVDENIAKVSIDSSGAWWEESIEEYLKIAVQRWYAPRLDNPDYPYGKWLDCRINGQRIRRESMEKVFKEIQYLYNYAADFKTISQKQKLEKENIYVRGLTLGGIVKQTDNNEPNGGAIAFKKYNKEELGMVRPINALSPYEYINCENISDSMNSPIVTYVRRPGMLINYELNSEWCNNIEVVQDEYLLAVYVPRSQTKLTTKSIPNLEEYLRRSEEADHASWCNIQVDGRGTRLVSSIKNGVRKALGDVYQQKEKKQQAPGATMLSKKFGKVLLPPRGYGNRSNGVKPNKPTSPSGISTRRQDYFVVEHQEYNSFGDLIVNFKLKLSSKVDTATVELIILSESGTLKADDWENEKNGIGTPFPVVIKDYSITSIDNNLPVPNDFLQLISSRQYNINNKLLIKNNKKVVDLKGQITIFSSDPFIQFSLAHKFEEGQ